MKTRTIILTLLAVAALWTSAIAEQDTMMKKQEPAMKSIPMMKKAPAMKKAAARKKRVRKNRNSV